MKIEPAVDRKHMGRGVGERGKETMKKKMFFLSLSSFLSLFALFFFRVSWSFSGAH